MEVCTVTAVWEQDGGLALQVAGYFPAYRPHSFRPVKTVNTDKQIEAMRNLMLDATVRGKILA